MNQVKSIDEAAENIARWHRRGRQSTAPYSPLTPRQEFWGHCSNLEAWAESHYDTRLIHRSLAFPLLRKLADIGDPLAQKRFKEEIALRLETGIKSVILYLLEGNYLKYFTQEELEMIYSINKNPSFWKAVQTYAEHGEHFTQLIPYIKKQIAEDPTNDLSWFLLSKGYQNLNRIREAIKLVMKAIRKKPDNLEYWLFLAELYFDKKDIPTTLSLLKFCKKMFRKSLFDFTMEELYDLKSKFETLIWDVKHYINNHEKSEKVVKNEAMSILHKDINKNVKELIGEEGS